MKKKIFNLILIILVCISTTMAVTSLISKSDMSDSKAMLKNSKEDDQITALKALMWDNSVNFLRDDGITIDGSIVVSDSSDVVHTINKLSGSKYKLIFRYSFLDCDQCVDTIFKKIESKKFSNLMVIADCPDPREFKIKMNYVNQTLPVYNILNGRLGLNMENKNLPFMFILGPDLKVSKMFVPLKEYPSQIDEYLDYIRAFLEEVNT